MRTFLRHMLFALVTVCMIVIYTPLHAQGTPKQVSVLLETEVTEGMAPSITLRWPKDTKALDYIIVRKLRSDGSFIPVATVDGTTSEWRDTECEAGVFYEYGIRKTIVKDSLYAYGYAAAGASVPSRPVRGHCLLLVDSIVKSSLDVELSSLRKSLWDEGWIVTLQNAPRTPSFSPDAVKITKDIIRAWWTSCDGEPATVILIGRIAVPYSGMTYQGQNYPGPDGHPEHSGAWAADTYYACMADDASWVDDATNNSGKYPDNKNLPDDGRFDNITMPGYADVRVGRIDFYNMGLFYKDSITVSGVRKVDSLRSEINLLRAYILRDIAFRQGVTTYKMRGLVDDNFGAYGEAFARSAWMNYSSLLGASNIVETDYVSTLDTASYLWSYGCGGGGSDFQSAGGIGNSATIATKKINTAFSMLFGSYFGDWDKANNLLRAPLAVNPGALTNCWAGRPFWYFHTMGLGETTGDAYLNTVNNDNTYVTGIYPTGVHIALMGDPTLRMPYTRIPIAGAVRAAQIDTPVKGVKLSWSAPSSGSVSGYYIYRQEGTGSWQVLNGEAVWADTTYVDEQLTDNIVRYAVRAVGPVRTASGTYYDIGPASETSLTVSDVPANEVVSVMCSPNPAQQALNIRCSVNATQDVRMEIYSVSGTLVQRLLPVRTDTTLDVVWDLHDASHTRVAAGVYLLRISYGTSSSVTPVHVLP